MAAVTGNYSKENKSRLKWDEIRVSRRGSEEPYLDATQYRMNKVVIETETYLHGIIEDAQSKHACPRKRVYNYAQGSFSSPLTAQSNSNLQEMAS